VPHAEAVRAARTALRRAEQAMLELAQIQVALARVERGLAVDPQWAASFASRWPELAVQPTDRTLLLAMRGALTPMARALAQATHRMHHVQHEQQAALAAPGLEALRAELDAELAELNALAERRTAPMQQTAALGPTLTVVERAVEDLATADPSRASALAEALVSSIAPIVDALQLDLAMPDLPRSEGRSGLEPADPRAAIEGLAAALRERYARARVDDERIQAAYEALNQRLLKRMG
jgi:hypothetical protein